jgi:hypothetical protein
MYVKCITLSIMIYIVAIWTISCSNTMNEKQPMKCWVLCDVIDNVFMPRKCGAQTKLSFNYLHFPPYHLHVKKPLDYKSLRFFWAAKPTMHLTGLRGIIICKTWLMQIRCSWLFALLASCENYVHDTSPNVCFVETSINR